MFRVIFKNCQLHGFKYLYMFISSPFQSPSKFDELCINKQYLNIYFQSWMTLRVYFLKDRAYYIRNDIIKTISVCIFCWFIVICLGGWWCWLIVDHLTGICFDDGGKGVLIWPVFVVTTARMVSPDVVGSSCYKCSVNLCLSVNITYWHLYS